MGGLGQTSDQILGDNNIGDGPFDLSFHARPAAVKQTNPSTSGSKKLLARPCPENVSTIHLFPSLITRVLGARYHAFQIRVFLTK